CHPGGVFEVPLPLRGENSARAVERRVMGDRCQDVVKLFVLRARVAHTVCRDVRQQQMTGEISERLVAMLFDPLKVSLKLDVQPPGKEGGQSLQFPAAGIETARRKGLRDEPFLTSRQAMQPIRVRCDLFPGDPCLAFRLVERSGSQEPTEILVTSPVL